MELWATKDHYELETEESERLVRPAPKVKPPRHDRRRETMKPDRDPDIEGDPDIARDKDMSLNYKNVGGSVIGRVVSRYLGYDPLALKVASRFFVADLDRGDLVPVVRKEDDKHVNVTEKTLKEHAGEYEKVKDAEPKKDDAFFEGAGRELTEKAKNDPKFESVMKSVMDGSSPLGGIADKNPNFPLSKALPGHEVPKGIETMGDLKRALGEAAKSKGKSKGKGKAPPHEKAPSAPSAGPAAPKPEGKPQTPEEKKPETPTEPGEKNDGEKKGEPEPASPTAPSGEDSWGSPSESGLKSLNSWLSEKGNEKPEFKAWEKKQKTISEGKDGEALYPSKDGPVPFEKLPPAEQLKVKSRFESHVKVEQNVKDLHELAKDPQTKAVLKELADPRSELRQRIESEAREERRDLSESDIKKTIPELAHLNLPKGMSSAQDLLDTADKAFAPPPEPKRPKVNKQEQARSEAAIQDTLPEDIAEQVSGMGLHPHDVSTLLSSYKSAMTAPMSDNEVADARKGLLAGGYNVDPETIEPPERVIVNGKKKKFAELSPADQAEAFAGYKMHVLASSLAARERVTQGLAKAGLPSGAAKVISEAMLKSGGKDIDDHTIQKFFSMSIATAFAQRPMRDDQIKKVLESVSDNPTARKLVSAYVQANNYAEARNLFLSNDPDHEKTQIREGDNPKTIAKKLEEASEFLRKKAEVLPLDARVVDTGLEFRNRVMDRMRYLAADKVPIITSYLKDYEMKDFESKKKAVEKHNKGVEDALKHETRGVEQEEAEREVDAELEGKSYKRPQGKKEDKEALARLRKKGLTPVAEPVQPPGYEHWKNRKHVEQSSKGALDWLKKLFSGKDKTKQASLSVDQMAVVRALLPSTRQRVAFLHEMGLQAPSGSSYPGYWSMGQSSTTVHTAVYWGQQPYEETAAYPGVTQLQARDFNDQDFNTILKAAREWLKMPVLGRPIKGLYPDTQYRAALDLALRDAENGKYSVGVYPTVYNELLAKLAAQPGPYELTTELPKSTPEAGVKTAGYGYALEAKSYLFTTIPKKPKPFNIDVIHAIQKTFISGKGDDGKVHDDLMIHFMDDKTSGSLSHIEEKQGAQLETRVDVQIPKGAESAATKAMVAIGKQFGFKVEPVGSDYKPKTRKPTGKSTYATTERGLIMKASAQVRSFAARTAAAAPSDPELAFDMLTLADRMAAEEQGQGQGEGQQQGGAEAQKQAAIHFAAQQVNKFNAVRSLVIKQAAANPHARALFLPLLQALKA